MPERKSYDVVIVGGAMMGSSVAWWLTELGFAGRILVVERDPTYEFASTSHTNSCIRQQFSTEINVRVSQFGAEFIKTIHQRIDGAPRLTIDDYGYLYLAASEERAAALREAHAVQRRAGAATELLSADEIRRRYPFYRTDDILLGSHNPVDEGFFDGATVFQEFRRSARRRGVEYAHDEVVAIAERGGAATAVTLKSGAEIACGTVVNAAGPRAAEIAAMIGAPLPVEPRRRYSYVFAAETPLEGRVPLTIFPNGGHFRPEGAMYLSGGAPDDDRAVAYDDFAADHSLWEEKFWPALADRVPRFEAIRVTNMWVGHYAMNTFDQNAIVGRHDGVGNFIFVNGFSGHGLQQAPAMGRGVAEWIVHGEYRSLNLTPFSHARIARGEPLTERAVI